MIKKLSKTSYKSEGFTLLEVLLVVAALAILAGIVIVAINPSKQLAAARNTQRRADVNTIINAVYQYLIDNGGNITLLPILDDPCNGAGREICSTTSCAGYTNLSTLYTAQAYLAAMPKDPNWSSGNGSGYYISKSSNGRVTVCAPTIEPEGGTMITVTR